MKKVLRFLILLFVAGLVLHHFFMGTAGADLPESENYPPTQGYHSYGELISDESKEVYDELERAVYGKPDEDNILCEFRDVDMSQAYLGYRAFTADHPEVFWITRASALLDHDTLYVLSIYPKDELEEKKKEFRASLEEFLESVPEGLDREELEWYANGYLVDHCEYDYEALALNESKDPDMDDSDRLKINEAGSAYGALVNGRAICEGYAHAYQLMLNRVGVTCVLIHGQGSPLVDGKRIGEVDHSWNAVRNGSTWLMTDVTWNDSTGDKSKYYNLPIEEMYMDHNARAIDIEDFFYSRYFKLVDDDDRDNLFLPE